MPNQTTNIIKLGTGEFASVCDVCIAAFGLEFIASDYPTEPWEYTQRGSWIEPGDACEACPDAGPYSPFRKVRELYRELRYEEPRIKLSHVYRAFHTWYRAACDALLADAFDYIYGAWPHTIEATTFTRELSALAARDPRRARLYDE